MLLWDWMTLPSTVSEEESALVKDSLTYLAFKYSLTVNSPVSEKISLKGELGFTLIADKPLLCMYLHVMLRKIVEKIN